MNEMVTELLLPSRSDQTFLVNGQIVNVLALLGPRMTCHIYILNRSLKIKKRTSLAHRQHKHKPQAGAVPGALVCGLYTLTSVAHGTLVTAGVYVRTLKPENVPNSCGHIIKT